MKKYILTKTNDDKPLIISVEDTVGIGEIGFLDGRIVKKFSDFQVFIKPIVVMPEDINENVLYKLEQGELEFGNTVNIY